MRRPLTVLALLAAAFTLAAVWAADAPKDTPGADHTRTKKLRAKVTVEYKQEMLRNILDDISGQVESQKLGKLGFAYATGVSANSRVDLNVKDVTVEEALDTLLKQSELGYHVVSKDKDRYDGWVRITKNAAERGYEAGTEPKTKDDPKKVDEPKKKDDEPKKKDDPKDPPKTDDEKAAAGKLGLAKLHISNKKPEKAKPILEEIIEKYPSTKAAAEAKQLLEKLNEK